MNLADVIGRWVGRVEIVLAGAEDDLHDGEQALASQDWMRARAAARRVLALAPGSPVGLALLADACDSAHLDAELALTLEELARRAPSRAEVWVRLGRARRETGAPTDEVRGALLRALAVAESGSDARVEALLALADLDLADHDGARADLWLARIVGDGPEVAVRRAEAHLLRGDAASAKKILEAFPLGPADGRAALALGRARAEMGEPDAVPLLLRAFVLDEPGASEALAGTLARIPTDAQVRTRVRSIVDAKGEQSLARWRAAFAKADGAREMARLALQAAVAAGEAGAARALLEASVEDRDTAGLQAALAALTSADDALVADGRSIAAAAVLDETRGADVLDAATKITHPRAIPWAADLARDVIGRWLAPPAAPADWTRVLARLDDLAHVAGDAGAAAAIARLAADRSTPVLLAIVGEFNAGKSTFINALVGAPVAPTGILPTTAVLHHLRWAPDSLAVAKIMLRPPSQPPERIVAPADLRATLAAIPGPSVERVEIRMPLPSLARVEILDTPGFNADVADHAAVAWSALDEADIALWLVDATQAVKQSERRVLDEAARRKLPVQVMVNKTDRLTREELALVLRTVDEGLASMGMTSWSPPRAFSSKRALAGRLGDAAALRESGWEAVDALVADVVARGDELKELSLRRRAARVVAGLIDGYRTLAARDESAARERAEDARTAAKAAAHVEQESEELAAALAATLEDPARRWAHDLSMIFVGRDARDQSVVAVDPKLERYRVDSAVAAVAPVLLREVTLLGPAALRPSLDAGALPVALRSIVRAAAIAVPMGADAPRLLAGAVSRASIAALLEHLLARATPAGRSPPALAGAALRELGAFAAALE